MSELPTGTVTFLFTDVERSTQTVGEVGDERYADLQDAHRQLLRDAFRAHGGIEVSTEGDAFFVAFARATDGVAAAIDGQLALVEGSELRVRMGLHTGEALVRGNDYVGHAVHKAKRVCDAGHGGQILISQTTADLIGSRFAFVDLGRHRLKDLGDDQSIFQVTAPGLRADFPQLRSLDSFRTNLPHQRSSFIGRTSEIASIRELLSSNRLVTLTGIGGSGKTRLAIQVGAEVLDHFVDGVYFCDLSAISSPDLVWGTVAGSVGASSGGPALASSSGPVEQIVLNHLKSRRCLILLDNCEHLLDTAAALVDRVLAVCPGVTVLATSREGLEVEGERSVRVPSLTLPSQGAEGSDALSLFYERAREVDPAFAISPENTDAVASICRRLDGIPLAIEFAASRVSHLSPVEIDARLSESFKLLGGGRRRVQRQATIEATLDWSFDLLSDVERSLLVRLSVFAGTFTLASAERVCAVDDVDRVEMLDLLAGLVSKSLLVVDSTGRPTLYRLLETVRQYAAQKLRDTGDSERFHDRHRDAYLERVEAIPWDKAFLDNDVLLELKKEATNILAAIEWSSTQNRRDLVARLLGRMYVLWIEEDYLDEGWRWVEFIGREPLEDIDVETEQAFFAVANQIAVSLQKRGREWLLQRVVALADGRPSVPACMAFSQQAVALSVRAAFTQDPDTAAACRSALQTCSDIASHLPSSFAFVPEWTKGFAEITMGDYAAGRGALEPIVPILASSSHVMMYIWCASALVSILHVQGDTDPAAKLAGSIIDRAEVNIGATCGPMVAIATALAAVGEEQRSKDLIGSHLESLVRSEVPGVFEELMIGVAAMSSLAGETETALRLLSWVRSRTIDRSRPIRSPIAYPIFVHYIRGTRAALDPDDARRIRDEGRAMTVEDAYACALEVLA